MLYKGRMRNNRVFSLLLNENFVVPYSSQTEKNYYSLKEGIEIAILLPKRALFTTSSSEWLFHYSKDKVSVIIYLQSLKKNHFTNSPFPAPTWGLARGVGNHTAILLPSNLSWWVLMWFILFLKSSKKCMCEVVLNGVNSHRSCHKQERYTLIKELTLLFLNNNLMHSWLPEKMSSTVLNNDINAKK